MIPVPLFDLKFLIEFAAGGAGTSNRRHYIAIPKGDFHIRMGLRRNKAPCALRRSCG
jgi:hypothetical protein